MSEKKCTELSNKWAIGDLLTEIYSVAKYLVMELDRGDGPVVHYYDKTRVRLQYELDSERDLIINIESDYKMMEDTVVIDSILSDSSDVDEPTQAYVFVRRASELEIIRTEIEEFLDWRV